MKLKVGHGILAVGTVALAFQMFLAEKNSPGLISNLFRSKFSFQFWVYGIQFIAIGMMVYFYKQRIQKPVSKIPSPVHSSLSQLKFNVFAKNSPELVRMASRRMMSCSSVLNFLITVWIFFYIFLCLKESGFLSHFFSEDLINSLIRIFNYSDSFLILVLSILFVAPSNIASIESTLIIKRWLLLIILAFLFASEIFILSGKAWEDFEIWISILGAVVASLCFLMLFARMESIFLEVNKYLIFILFLYGVFQSFYPLEMINMNGIRSNEIVGQFILYFGTFIKLLGKVILAFIVCSRHYRNKLIVYFYCLFNFVDE